MRQDVRGAELDIGLLAVGPVLGIEVQIARIFHELLVVLPYLLRMWADALRGHGLDDERLLGGGPGEGEREALLPFTGSFRLNGTLLSLASFTSMYAKLGSDVKNTYSTIGLPAESSAEILVVVFTSCDVRSSVRSTFVFTISPLAVARQRSAPSAR